MDQGDAMIEGFSGGIDRNGLAIHLYFTLVGRLDSGQNLHQGTLPGSILTDETEHLTLPEGEVNAIEGTDAGKALANPPNCEQRGNWGNFTHPKLTESINATTPCPNASSGWSKTRPH